MIDPDATTTNVAEDSAYVGVQAGTVHGGVHTYVIPAGASPEEKFETGVRLLDGGMAGRARQLIGEAVEEGHAGNRVCFYWQLALVSGRARHEMSMEDTAMLRSAPDMCCLAGADEWADGARTICRLLDCAQKPDEDLRLPLKDFDRLGPIQRATILRHLELYLDGPLEDQIWDRALKRANQEQMVGDRADRVWKFFQPEPAPPRVRAPRQATVSIGTWFQAIVAMAVFAGATIHIGYLVIREGQVSGLLAYLVSIIGGYAGARSGVEWRFRALRRRMKDEEYGAAQWRRTTAQPGGFAKKVDRQFEYYSAKYVPNGVERSDWLAQTAGIRRSIRDEIVEAYREQRIGVERISWLIRYRVGDIRKRWQDSTLWSYQKELATPLPTKVIALLGIAALIGGGIRTVEGITPADPSNAVRSTALALVTGLIGAHAWLRVILERRRYAADESESTQALAGAMEAYHQWQAKLADKPEDGEMAGWLDCDRKVLLDEALRHYKLTMSNVIAHAFIEAQAASAARARVRNGPWRYLKYQLLVFLLTADGVRQLDVTLDFERGTFHDRHRTNYRYEAVAVVRVRQTDDEERKFELALVNGERISVAAIGPGMEELQPGENPGTVAEVTLDAAGIQHTLHVLEGIAAEGKEWISQERQRGKERTANPTPVI